MVHAQILLILIVSALWLANAHGYGAQMHRAVNAVAEDNLTVLGGIDLNTYLRNTLLFPEGRRSLIDREEVWEWIRDGGALEDDPPVRTLNHFLDPLRWSADRGLGGLGGQAADRWAINDDGVQTAGVTLGMSTGGDFSWPAALEYYFIGVTGHATPGPLPRAMSVPREDAS